MQNHVYDEHSHSLQIYWSTKDVIAWLAENSDDEHLKKMKQTAELHAQKMEVVSRSVHDERALFDEDEDDGDDEIVLGRPEETPAVAETSTQRLRSQNKEKPVFEGLKTNAAGHKIQEIKELMTVPVSFPALYMCDLMLTKYTRLLSLPTSQRARQSSRFIASTPTRLEIVAAATASCSTPLAWMYNSVALASMLSISA
jgi:hypothetical protein